MAFTPSFDYATNEVFEQLFQARLTEGGVRINNLFETISFNGATYYIRQYDAPDEAVTGDTVGDTFDPTSIEFWRRRMTPTPWKYSVTLDDFDIARTGGFDIGLLAQKAADGCAKSLDRIVIEAVTADVYCDNNNTISFNSKQYIAHDYSPDQANPTSCGLTSYKILKAVEKMRTNGVMGPLICFSNYTQLTEFKQDQRVASTDFNIQPAMATNIDNPYGGVSGFVPSVMLPNNILDQDGDTYVDHVYVVGTDYIKIGTNMPWKLDSGANPQQNFNQQLMMKGMYCAVRKEEAACVIIECKHVDQGLIV